uniref:Uncharacterized protein n=1 Tax=Palpitomonas bilix TaxID=652834 RepID=A0A7S3DMA6_9EUKA|mmetsp:Transcript_43057/g.111534  ORF Transcript_43057/g.111534 Transcript_43057/m.111534 type:complete len:165 (+) Transcript_43057:783-1277(+)
MNSFFSKASTNVWCQFLSIGSSFALLSRGNIHVCLRLDLCELGFSPSRIWISSHFVRQKTTWWISKEGNKRDDRQMSSFFLQWEMERKKGKKEKKEKKTFIGSMGGEKKAHRDFLFFCNRKEGGKKKNLFHLACPAGSSVSFLSVETLVSHARMVQFVGTMREF